MALFAFCVSLVLCVSVVPSLSFADDGEPHAEKTEQGGDHGKSEDEHGHGREGNAHGEGSHAVDPQATNPLTINPDLAIVTALVFLALLWFLYKFAWGPIIEALDNREQNIANQIDEANQNFKKAQEQLAIYDKKLAAAADESRAIIDTARQDAEAVAVKIRTEAEEDAKRSRERALADIEAAKNSALRDIAEKSADMAVSLAGNIVQREVKSSDHADLIRSALDKMPSNN